MSTNRTNLLLLLQTAAIPPHLKDLLLKSFTSLTCHRIPTRLFGQPRFPWTCPRTLQCRIPKQVSRRGRAMNQPITSMVGLGLDLKVISLLQWVFPQLVCPTHELSVDQTLGSAPAAPALERGGHGRLSRDRGSAPARLDASQDGMVRLHDQTISHYYDCYWKYFHPLCPIVHFATFMSTPRPEELATIILAVGAQLSPNVLAGSHSMSFYTVSLRLLRSVSFPFLSRG